MKILVTGGAGFIGSNFVRHVLTTHPDDSVVNLDKLTYAGNPQNLADFASEPRYRFVHGDICDGALVRDLIAGVDAVVHFAAETHVDRSIHAGYEFVTSNVIGICSSQNPGRCICTTGTCGAGLLDAEQAVLYAQAVQGGGTYTPPSRSGANIDSSDVMSAVALGRDEPSGVAPPIASDGGGGGALDPAWLIALALAVLMIARAPRRAR